MCMGKCCSLPFKKSTKCALVKEVLKKSFNPYIHCMYMSLIVNNLVRFQKLVIALYQIKQYYDILTTNTATEMPDIKPAMTSDG